MNNISKITVPKITLTKNDRVAKPSVGLQHDTFEKSKKEPFDLKAAVDKLSEVKDGAGSKKFLDGHIYLMEQAIKETPEKFDAIYSLAKNPVIGGITLSSMLPAPVENLNIVSELAEKKIFGTRPKFYSGELIKFSKMDTENLKKVKPLADTFMDFEGIKLAVESEKINQEKLLKEVGDLTEKSGKMLKNITFNKNKYRPQDFVLEADIMNYGSKIKLLDKDMNVQATEDVALQYTQRGKKYQIVKTNDFRNNTVSKVRKEILADPSSGLPREAREKVVNEVRVVKDAKGKVLRREYTDLSDVNGVYNIKNVYPDGKTEIISSGKVDKKTGITTVMKDMTSLDGTRTQYEYHDDPQGNRIMDYKITEKNGNVLLQKSQTFEVISENKFISSNNGKSYEITADEKSLNIKDLATNKETQLKFDDYINGNQVKLTKALKQMPGDELIKLSENVKSLSHIDNLMASSYNPNEKKMITGDNLFVILHELGHTKDLEKMDFNNPVETEKNTIYSDENVVKSFREEKELFNKEFPNAQREHINYFVDELTHYTGNELGGLREAIAESNAMLNTYNNVDNFAIRSQYLQQYFPRTIANISKKLDE